MQRLFACFMLILFSVPVLAQNTTKESDEKIKPQTDDGFDVEENSLIAYPKTFVFGGKLTNTGYGISLEWGRIQTKKTRWLYQFEISEVKHRKEEKLSSLYSQSIPFVYGKINYFYPVKLGIQQQMLLGNKDIKNGVSVTANWGGGISLGLLRPYYVQVERGNGLEYIKYDGPDSTDFISVPIYAGPSLNKGWSDVKLTPGVYAKAALRFDYGIFDEVITALEVGVSADYYTKKIPQMVFNEQKQFFYNAYFSLLFGKRK